MGKIAKLEADLVDGRERDRELERKIAETKRKNDDLEAQLSEQNTEVRDGKAKIGELEGKINALQSKNFDLETQIDRTMTFLKRDGWSYLAKTASWYKVIDQGMTFDEAVAYCASRKSHLVSIHSQEENDFVCELAKTVDSLNWFWIGLKRNPNKGNALEWTDGSAVDFTNWRSGEQDSYTHAASKNSDLETQIQFERENKTAEIMKLQADLNRTMNLLDPGGWSYLAKTASWYKAFDQWMTFDDAVAYCASRKGHLVTIHSQEEHDFIWKLARTVRWHSSFWIGLKRNPNREDAFEWTDGSSVDFTNWRVEEPDSYTHAALWSGHGKWGAYAPTNLYRFICKMSSQF
ncbi:unnamed protein product, partial [Mesorhabditis belari]|uniref:C-type lectin domain-containing protein n=1 Tax=Mesorhabditis belari TaxID=2138241 RepID=A0AAF3EQ86_9BILA